VSDVATVYCTATLMDPDWICGSRGGGERKGHFKGFCLALLHFISWLETWQRTSFERKRGIFFILSLE
jgi:hypothetical protein